MTSLYVETDAGWVRMAKTSTAYLDDRERYREEYDALWVLGKRLVDAGVCRQADTLSDRSATTPGATIDGAPVFDGLGAHKLMHDVLMTTLERLEVASPSEET